MARCLWGFPLVLSLLFIAACSSSAPPDSLDDVGRSSSRLGYGPHAEFGAPWVSLTHFEDISLSEDYVGGEPVQVYRYVLAVYRELGLPLTTINPEALLAGLVNERVTERIGGHRLDDFLSCGWTIAGHAASHYEIYLTAVTQVDTTGPRSPTLATHVRAVALQGGRAGSGKQCSTNGRFEREIAKRVQLKLVRDS